MTLHPARFGQQRLERPEVGTLEKLYFRVLGLADPAHYIHSLYFLKSIDELGLREPQRIFDAGCGSGDYSLYLARRFPNAEIVAWDIDTQAIARNLETAKAMGISNIRFEVADLSDLDFENHFDFVFSVDVLEHLPNQQVVLQKLARALKPTGVAFYHIPTVRLKPAPLSKFLKGFHEWAEAEHVAEDLTHEQFRQAVEASGLDVKNVTQSFGYFTGELANSLFVLPYKNTPLNRLLQAGLAPLCRLLAMLDPLDLDHPRYAVAVNSVKRASSS